MAHAEQAVELIGFMKGRKRCEYRLRAITKPGKDQACHKQSDDDTRLLEVLKDLDHCLYRTGNTRCCLTKGRRASAAASS